MSGQIKLFRLSAQAFILCKPRLDLFRHCFYKWHEVFNHCEIETSNEEKELEKVVSRLSKLSVFSYSSSNFEKKGRDFGYAKKNGGFFFLLFLIALAEKCLSYAQ